MARRHQSLRDAAASVIEECGEYARMAALFHASELREDGDDEGALLWARIAFIIAEMDVRSPASLRLH